MNPTRKRFLRWSLAIILTAVGVAVGLVWMSIRHPKNHYSAEQLVPFLTANELELFSVHPSQLDYGDDPFAPDAPKPKHLKTPFGDFQGFPVLGVCKITDPAEIEIVRKAVHSLDAAGRHWDGGVVMCFMPRHGVRVRSGEETRDLLICYECSRGEIFQGDTEVGVLFFSSLHSSPSPKDLNGLLTAHAVALPKEPKH